MGFLDRLLGREGGDPYERDRQSEPPRRDPGTSDEDRRALERYHYLLRTAPPERIEEAHEEAFAKLTPEQRRLALEELSRAAPEEPASGDDPRSLARLATRAEMRRPGTVERAFGRGGMGGMGMGGMGGLGMGAGLLGSFATAFAGTLAAQALFADLADGDLIDSVDFGDEGGDPGGADTADAGGSDLGGGDFGGGDFGGDAGF
jgi:hypothetical protein